MDRKNYVQATIEKFGSEHPKVELKKSMILDHDIVDLENKLDIIIPNAVKDYLRSYTLSVPFVTGKMLGDFSKTYCEETGGWRELEIEEEIATTILQLPLMFPNKDLYEFEQSNAIFRGTGFLYLGLYNEEYYVLLDLQSEQVYRADMERVRPTLGADTRADILRWALPFFYKFEDLVRCFFGGELYDEDELTFDIERDETESIPD